MNSRDFCYWLQGLFELGNPVVLDEKQTDLIKRHLNLVFYHEIDPSYSDDPEEQAKMQEIHDTPVIDTLTPLSERQLQDMADLAKKLELGQHFGDYDDGGTCDGHTLYRC